MDDAERALSHSLDTPDRPEDLIESRLSRVETSCDKAHQRLRAHDNALKRHQAEINSQHQRLLGVERTAGDVQAEMQMLRGEVGGVRSTISGVVTQIQALERAVADEHSTIRSLFERFDAHLLDTRDEAAKAAAQAHDDALTQAEEVRIRLDRHESVMRNISRLVVLVTGLLAVALAYSDGKALVTQVLGLIGLGG